MKLHIVYFATVACLCSLAGLAPATIVIDDFSTAQSVPVSTSQEITGPGILGQERRVYTDNYSTAEINTTYPNQAYFSNTDYSLYVSLIYDGIGSSINGLNNMDLTEGGKNDGFRVTITDVGPAEVRVCIDVKFNNNRNADLSYQVSGPQELFFPFEDFTEYQEAGIGVESLSLEDPVYSVAQTSVDFTDVGYIAIYVYSQNKSANITLGPLTVIPEPATLLLLATGGVALMRKRK